MRLVRHVGLALALLAVGGLAAPFASAQERARLTADEQAGGSARAEQREASDYWIGVRCAELPELLRAQLDLPENQGVLIDQVIADAPAQQAGLKAFDVIVSVSGNNVHNPGDVAEAVANANGEAVTLEYLRGGKRQTVAVKPAPRPGALAPRGRDQRSVERWFKRLGEGPLSMRFLHPGMVLPPGASMAPSLPGDMTVTIEKQGEKPAKVTVKQGDKTWQAAEDSLDKLPDEARNYAQRMLGLSAVEMRYIPLPPGDPAAPPEATRPHAPPADGMEERLNRRIEDLNRQIEQLRKVVDKLGDGGA